MVIYVLGRNYFCIYLNLFDVLGVGTHKLGRMFWELMIFEWNNRAKCWLIFKYSCVIYVTVYAFFPCDCFLSLYLPFYFLSYLNIVFNSFRIHTCYALAIVSDIHKYFLKVNMEFIVWCSILMNCSCFYLIAWKSMNDYNWMLLLPLLEFCVWSFTLSLSFLTPLPNGYMCCFNHLHNLNCWL